jgi:hypothetical protein
MAPGVARAGTIEFPVTVTALDDAAREAWEYRAYPIRLSMFVPNLASAAFALGVAVACIAGLVFRPSDTSVLLYSLSGAAGLAVWNAWIPAASTVGWLGRARRARRTAALSPLARADHTAVLAGHARMDFAGMTVHFPRTAWWRPWAAVHQVARTEDYLFVSEGPRGTIVVPRGAFSEKADFDHVVREAVRFKAADTRREHIRVPFPEANGASRSITATLGPGRSTAGMEMNVERYARQAIWRARGGWALSFALAAVGFIAGSSSLYVAVGAVFALLSAAALLCGGRFILWCESWSVRHRPHWAAGWPGKHACHWRADELGLIRACHDLTTIEWRGVESVEVRRRHVVIWADAGGCMAIPPRAFGSARERNDFLAFCREQLSATRLAGLP